MYDLTTTSVHTLRHSAIQYKTLKYDISATMQYDTIQTVQFWQDLFTLSGHVINSHLFVT